MSVPSVYSVPRNSEPNWRIEMHGIIYLVGLVVIVMAILSFLGLG